jgi:hypothetical protein
MAPILIEPLSEKAYELLRQLEALNILRVVSPEGKPVADAPRKWAGSIPATSAEAWDKHLQEIRGEWERGI